MRIKSRAVFDPNTFKALNIPAGRGYLLLEVEDEYRAKVGEEVKKIVKRQSDKLAEAVSKWNSVPPEQRGPEPVYRDFLLDLELELNIHYAKRSIDQNARYWKIREIQANWVNGSPVSRRGYFSKLLPDGVVTPEDLHNSDIEAYCEKHEWTIWRRDRNKFARAVEFAEMGRVTKEMDVEGFPDKLRVIVTKTTSFFTTVEHIQWTTRVINEITDSGLLRADEAEFQMLRQDFEDIIKGKKKEKTK